MEKKKRERDTENIKSINLKVRVNKDMYINLLKYSQSKGITPSQAKRVKSPSQSKTLLYLTPTN